MDMDFAYQIMRVNKKVVAPTSTAEKASQPPLSASPQRACASISSGLHLLIADGSQQSPRGDSPCLARQPSAPQRSLGTAMLCTGSAPMDAIADEQEPAQPRCATPEFPRQPRSGRATSSSTGDGDIELALHLVPRSQLPSARGVTIGPFSEAIDAAATAGSKSTWRRQAAGLLLHSPVDRNTSASPLLLPSPDPNSPSPSGSPHPICASPPSRAEAAPRRGAVGRATSAVGLQPTPPASPPPQLLLPQTASYKARRSSLVVGSNGSVEAPSPTPQEDRRSSHPNPPQQPHPPGGRGVGGGSGRPLPGRHGLPATGMLLRSAASAKSLSPIAGGSISGGGGGDLRSSDASDIDGWLDSPASAASPSLGTHGSVAMGIKRLGSSTGPAGGGVGAGPWSSRGGGSGAGSGSMGVVPNLGLVRAASGVGMLPPGVAGPFPDPHAEPSQAVMGGDNAMTHIDTTMAVAAAGGGRSLSGAAAAATSRLVAAAGLVTAVSLPSMGADSLRFLPSLPSSTSVSGEAAPKPPGPAGGDAGGSGGEAAAVCSRVQFRQPAVKTQHTPHQLHLHKQPQQPGCKLKAWGSAKDLQVALGPELSGGSNTSYRGGTGGLGDRAAGDEDLDAAAVELASLEQWAAVSGGHVGGLPQQQHQPSMAALCATVEQRRALRRLEYLRSRLLRDRGNDSPEPGLLPSWAVDIAHAGRLGSTSLASLATQVSRLPHIDYDQMRDPQYRMLLKLRSRQTKGAVPQPAQVTEDLDEVPSPGRRRPWKPLHL